MQIKGLRLREICGPSAAYKEASLTAHFDGTFNGVEIELEISFPYHLVAAAEPLADAPPAYSQMIETIVP